MKIFITGGTGDFGKKLITKLDSKKIDLTILSIDKHKSYSENNARYVTADLLNAEKYREYLQNTDLIIHMAAVTHTNREKLYYEVNTKGTRKLIQLAKEKNVPRFIFISTRAIADEGGSYSQSKRLAEDIVKSSGLKWLILRPAEVYGPNTSGSITKLIKNIEKMAFVPIIGKGQYRIAPVHIDDVISALVKAVENTQLMHKIYTLAGPEEMTFLDFVNKLLIVRNKNRLKIYLPIIFLKILANVLAFLDIKDPLFVKDQIPRLMSSKSSDISAARADLDFNPRKISQFIS